MRILRRALLSSLIAILLISCAQHSNTLERTELFSIGYGPGPYAVDFSNNTAVGAELAVREGIFYLLDKGGRKLLKLSAYGDFLAAPSSRFARPTALAISSGRMLYIADKGFGDRSPVYDSVAKTFSNTVIRRISGDGEELAWLGQEGPGGSAFPTVGGIQALADDSIAVISSSDSAYLVHRFDAQGSLISSLVIQRTSLPLPEALLDGEAGGKTEGLELHLDSIVCSFEENIFKVFLKIDYYRNEGESQNSILSRVSYAGSWIFTCDGRSGDIKGETRLRAAEEAGIPELIGRISKTFFLLGRSERSWSILAVGDNGSVLDANALELPDGADELMELVATEEGRYIGLVRNEEGLKLYMWSAA